MLSWDSWGTWGRALGCVTEPQDGLGWKSPLSSPSATRDLTPPCHQGPHPGLCKHLQGQ